MSYRTAATLLLVLLAGCDRCGDENVPSRLRAEKPLPYVRCLAADPPPARKWKLGRLGLELRERELTIEGLPARTRVAAFSGPAFSTGSPREAIGRMAEAKPDLALMLGGAGDRGADAARTLELLGELQSPTLVLAGGRDSWPRWLEALDSLDGKGRDRVIDITTLARVRLGARVLLPVAGAAEGRYAIGADACGFGKEDLQQRRSRLGPGKEERRWLVSWETPGGKNAGSPAHVLGGLDVGSVALADFARRTGVRGGLFGWPYVQVMRPRDGEGRVVFDEPIADLSLSVPRIVGPAMERDDGSRKMPGFAMVVFSSSGAAVASSTE